MDVSTLITTGNECDVEFAECLEWMALHPGIDVIVAVAEGPRDGPALRRALAAARERRKPVVMLKMGRSETGAAAAASHTASLAGSDAVYDAVMEAEGVWRATDTDELLDVAYAACVGVLPASTRTGLLTVSGGGGIQLADAAERHGVAIPPMPESAQERIRSRLPYASPANPVDITAQVFNEPELLPLNLDAMLEEGDYDAVVVFFTYVAGAPAMAETLIDLAASVRERYPDRLLVQCVVAPREILARYETLGSPCFEDPDRAVRAIAALAYFARVHARTTQPALAPVPPGVGDLGSGGTLDEARSMALLAAAGLPAPRLVLATRAEEAVAAARDMGGEVALKVCDPQVVHKSDVGGVALGIRGDGTVARAYAEVCERITAARGTPPEAVLVTPMAGPGVDMILGLQRDPVFGPVVMVGVGGIFVEVLRDVRLAPAPVDEAGALSLLRQLKGWPLLCGARGRAPADVEALCRCISALSHLAVAAGERLRSVDINPLRVFPRGQGALMLDAVVIADQPGPPEQRDEDTPTP